MEMTPDQLNQQERHCSGTSWTRHESFDRDGYLVLPALCDPEALAVPVPHQRGQVNYWGRKLDQFSYSPDEAQVPGSLATYNRPQYREEHARVRLALEQTIGRRLYNTYYYDRFYWSGQALSKHADRDACEISVTIHVGSSLAESWPIWVKTPDTYADKTNREVITTGEHRSVLLQPGDAMLYKGCERPHWREPMPGDQRPGMESWHHQIFMHYVLQDGVRAHCAWDRGR